MINSTLSNRNLTVPLPKKKKDEDTKLSHINPIDDVITEQFPLGHPTHMVSHYNRSITSGAAVFSFSSAYTKLPFFGWAWEKCKISVRDKTMWRMKWIERRINLEITQPTISSTPGCMLGRIIILLRRQPLNHTRPAGKRNEERGFLNYSTTKQWTQCCLFYSSQFINGISSY